MKTPKTLIFAAASFALVGISNAKLVMGEAQFNSGNVLPSPIVAVSNDLLETSVASVVGEKIPEVRNGSTGTAYETSGTTPAVVYDIELTTYTLDTSVNTFGYDISEILLFSGWSDDRAGQDYTISYSVVGSADFVTLGTQVTEAATNGSLVTRTYDDGAGNIATGVDQIRFQFHNYNATATVFREFDVIGVAAIPEPGSYALLAGLAGLTGLVSVMARRRRS